MSVKLWKMSFKTVNKTVEDKEKKQEAKKQHPHKQNPVLEE